MKKRLICILLAAVMLLGTLGVAPITAEADSVMTASQEIIYMIKFFEGFSRFPYWDNRQWTVGYGTRCPDEDLERYQEEGISQEEAEALLKIEIAKTETAVNRFIDNHGLDFDQGKFDALVSFSYNVGTGWLNKDGLLRGAVLSGAEGNDFLAPFCLWVTSGGKTQKGLIIRRLKEANVYLNGVYSTDMPADYGYVIYDGNGGSTPTHAQGYEISTTAVPVAVATYDDNVFLGWFTAKTGGTQITTLDDATNGRTLYAQWEMVDNGEVTEPTEPEPTEPEPTEPEPTEPKPTEPKPTEPPVTEPPVEEEPTVEVKVTGDIVNVRKGPGTGYGVAGTVKKGQSLTITETASGSGYLWGKFEKGWIALKYTNYDEVMAGGEEAEDRIIATGTVTNVTGRLRIRSAASTSSSIVGYLSNGAKVELYEIKTVGSIEWGRIEKGWISMDYILLDSSEEEEEPETPPVTEPEEPETPPVTEPEDPEKVMGTVVNAPSGLRIRSKAGTSGATVGRLKNGDRVEILETTKVGSVTWGRISKGWICMDYVKLDSVDNGSEDEKPEDKVIATGTVTGITGNLNVRSSPGTGTVVAKLKNGTKVEIFEKKTVSGVVWGRIEKGWISLDYVKLDSTGSGSDNGSADKVIDTGVVISTTSLRIRSGAGTGYSVVGTLSKGAKVSIYEIKTVGSTRWGRIDKGWICLDYVKLDSTASNESAVHTVTASSLRIRSGAGTGYAIVGYLTRGEKVTVLETKTVGGTVWGRISKGWISMEYVD